MTTASTNTTIANNSNATFQAWVNEIYTNLVTNCGLSQTADTGQMAVPCVTALPGASTVGGYYVFKFNDTLQATSPIFIKMEFGTGSITTTTGSILLLITVGTSTNGSGTITGTTLSRSAVSLTNAVAGGTGVTNFVSRYCYNATQGFLGMAFKIGAAGTSPQCLAGFMLYRSVDNTGAPTATAVNLLVWSYGGITSSVSQGSHAYIDYSLSTSGQLGTPNAWGFIPFSAASSLEGTTAQVFPVFSYGPTSSTPGFGVANTLGLVIAGEIALNATFSATIIGALSLTYINVGCPFGSSNTNQAYPSASYSLAMLWQ